MPSSKKSKKPQKASSQQPATEQSTQGTVKGEQLVQHSPQQLVQDDLAGQTPQPPLLGQSMREASEATHPHPKQSSKPPPEQEDSKGKQPTRKPVYGNPRFWIARIPAKKKARLQRVVLSIAPDTVCHHPQTFFFKNLPSVEPYWGYTNDSAWTAQRVVRLETGGKPTPYFLLVCRGEHPEVKSARNENVVFKGMHVPIFNDAFVFKLADPEIDEDGYANYVHIEEDIDGIDWLPDAIRDAARKVDDAMARDANPGFPDIENYADPETMEKDKKTMLSWMRQIRRVTETYSNVLPEDGTSERPKSQTVAGVLERMTIQLEDRIKDGTPSMDKGPESPDPNTAQYWIERATLAFEALQVSTDDLNDPEYVRGALSGKKDAFGRDNSFQKMMDAFYHFIVHLYHAKTEDKAIKEARIAFVALRAQVDKHEAFMKRKVAEKVGAAGKADAARTSGENLEMPDLPGHPGTSQYRVERLS